MATNKGKKTRLSDAAHALRDLLVKVGSDADHIAVADAGDLPIGICPDMPSGANQEVAVLLPGCAAETQEAPCSEAIGAGVPIFGADDGKVSLLPAAAGTYYRVGTSINATAAADEILEYDPCLPYAVVVEA